jgi:chromosome segregation ATPase
MAIPSVVQGTIETEDGKVFELDSPKGAAWVEAIGSFRFEPSGNSKAYTVRREPSGYWYGCRKVAGKVRKKYIGKSSQVSIAKLEEIAEALEVPSVPRVGKVAEVAQEVAQSIQVTQVAEVAQDRLATLESEVAMLRQAVEALQEALPGKSEAGDSEELPKVNSKVAEELQNELSNLKAENEKLKQELVDARAGYAKLLESSGQIKASREKEISELRSQLETEKTRGEEIWEELSDTEQALAEVRSENSELKKNCDELRSQLETEKTRGEEIWEELSDTEQALAEVRSENSELKKNCDELRSQLEQERADREKLQKEFNELNERHLARVFVAEALQNEKSATASKDLPEAAEILNQLKSKRKKSKADLADLEVVLEILEK